MPVDLWIDCALRSRRRQGIPWPPYHLRPWRLRTFKENVLMSIYRIPWIGKRIISLPDD